MDVGWGRGGRRLEGTSWFIGNKKDIYVCIYYGQGGWEGLAMGGGEVRWGEVV